jgi:hypothetical protein
MITLRQNNQDKLIAGIYEYPVSDLSSLITVTGSSAYAYRNGHIVQVICNAVTSIVGLPAPKKTLTIASGVTLAANGLLSATSAYTGTFMYLTE